MKLLIGILQGFTKYVWFGAIITTYDEAASDDFYFWCFPFFFIRTLSKWLFKRPSDRFLEDFVDKFEPEPPEKWQI